MTTPRPAVFFGQALADYGFEDGHPLGRDRLAAFETEFRRRGLDRQFDMLAPVECSDDDLALFHDPAYVRRATYQCSVGFGYLDRGDTPALPGLDRAGRCIAGSALQGVKKILSGECGPVFLPIGGIHHPRRDRAAGFGVFNDCGIVISALRQRFGVTRIGYVDIDAHHGDGVYYSFEDDPDLIIADIHEDGRHLYPGTGGADETGSGEAIGTKLNIPMLPGSTDRDFFEAWQTIEAFIGGHEPAFLILQAGVDSLAGDPLAHLAFSAAAHAHAATRMRAMSRTFSQDRLLVLGGGGYNLENIAQGWCDVCAALL